MKKHSPDSFKGPGSLDMRRNHGQAKARARRDRDAALKSRNPLAQNASRWQRFVRYVWDKKR